MTIIRETVAETFQKRDYPDHTCPEKLEPHGDRRVGYHGGEGGVLLSVCLIQTACGCSVVGNGTLMHPVMIEPCDEHQAAMYPSLS